jgi:hypothetical protein
MKKILAKMNKGCYNALVFRKIVGKRGACPSLLYCSRKDGV